MPKLNIESVKENNELMKEELQKEFITESRKSTKTNTLNVDSEFSNNLFLASEDEVEEKKETLTNQEYNKYGERGYNKNSIILEDDDPEIIKIKEYIEMSYEYLYSGKIETSKIFYLRALSLYDSFDYDKKTKIYITLYDLYNKIISKK
ncbi:MAG: hypothetical protein KatS3mg002_0806 [Candidatus Woesearchaeota archaeon]|nr:MAG: hypothetical protein KatS3mg002_0806 [Candidatus Woesearchaeota archaeon]